MTIQEAQQQLLFQLYHIYDNREAATIADWVMEHLTGWKKIDRIINKKLPLLPHKTALLQQYTEALLAHKPVQYVLNESWFCGMPFYVDENVLIPRPETEELVEWIVKEVRDTKSEVRNKELKLLDIGTGSGCIAVSLKKKLPEAAVYACDVSEPALTVAAGNAARLETPVQFIQMDILDSSNRHQLPQVSIIVSNPPYIPVKDKATMNNNVLAYEPHLALFVENGDPLVFYSAIAELGQKILLPSGAIYVEIHEDLGTPVRSLFLEKGYQQAVIKKDMQGKDRMVKVEKE